MTEQVVLIESVTFELVTPIDPADYEDGEGGLQSLESIVASRHEWLRDHTWDVANDPAWQVVAFKVTPGVRIDPSSNGHA